VLTIEPQRAECPNALSSHRELRVAFQDIDDDDVHAIMLLRGSLSLAGIDLSGEVSAENHVPENRIAEKALALTDDWQPELS
jgi:hypothetical protein